MTIEKSPQLAEVKLKYQCQQPMNSFPKVASPQEAVDVLREIWDEETIQLKEEFVILLLNNVKKCLGWCKISSGGSTATIVDPSTIFQVSLLANATSIILAHNHPSGNTDPSSSDIKLTKRIQNSGKMLGIEVDDHLILSDSDYMSFRSRGII